MRYEFMFPKQLAYAKEKRLPMLLPLGTIEYHGPHCAYGCDGLIAQGLAQKLEAERELVILPTFWYGASSYAVGGPEKGTLHVDGEILIQPLKGIFVSLLEGGFRNIAVLIHHQFEQENYMPTTLAAATAAKAVTMAYLEETRGRGWWGDNASSSYYSQLDASDNPFNWIRVLPCMSREVQNATGYDHAGQFECSILAALYPEAVNLEDLKLSDEWFIQNARESSAGYGRKMVELCLEDLRAKLFSVLSGTKQKVGTFTCSNTSRRG